MTTEIPAHILRKMGRTKRPPPIDESVGSLIDESIGTWSSNYTTSSYRLSQCEDHWSQQPPEIVLSLTNLDRVSVTCRVCAASFLLPLSTPIYEAIVMFGNLLLALPAEESCDYTERFQLFVDAIQADRERLDDAERLLQTLMRRSLNL